MTTVARPDNADLYTEAMFGFRGSTMITDAPRSRWALRHRQVGERVVQGATEGAASCYHGEADAQLLTFVLALPAVDAQTVNGIGLDATLMIVRPRDELFAWSPGPNRWASLSIPANRLGDFTSSQVERLMDGPSGYALNPAQLARASVLIRRALGARELDVERAGRLLEEYILERVVADQSGSSTLGVASSHARVANRIRDFIESASPMDHTVHCMAKYAGVSEQFLRRVTKQHYGASPKQLLLCAQLNRIRRDVLNAPTDETISQIALRHGVTEFGRMAVRYRRLFGETPSETRDRRTAADDASAGRTLAG